MELVDFIKDSNDYTWDYKLHFPVPTLNYIEQRTGQSMLARFNSVQQAEGNLVALVRSAKNFLFKNRLDEKEQVYTIAHDRDRLYEVLEYILEFINFAFTTGDYADFFKLENTSKKSQALESACRQFLGAKMILLRYIDYGDGY